MWKIYPRERVSRKSGQSLRYFMARYQKPNGSWSTKDIPVNIQSERDADRWMRANYHALISGAPVVYAPTAASVTIRQLYPEWKRYCEEERVTKDGDPMDPKSIGRYFTTFDTYVLTHPIADLDLAQLKTSDCSAWLVWLKGQRVRGGHQLAPFTIRDHAQSMRAFFKDARKKEWVDLASNPFADELVTAEIPTGQTVAKKKLGKKTIIYLTKDEACRLISCASETIPMDRKVRNLFVISTGARAGEVFGLKWSDVQLTSPIPQVAIQRQLVKAGIKSVAKLKPPKKKSYRDIPLHPLTVRALQYWQEEGWRKHVGRDPKPDDPVFPNINGASYYADAALLFRNDLAAAGLPILFKAQFNFTFHATRRTFATLLKINRVDSEARGALLGHAPKDVGDSSYEHDDLSWLYSAVKKLPLPASLPWLPSANTMQKTKRTTKGQRAA